MALEPEVRLAPSEQPEYRGLELGVEDESAKEVYVALCHQVEGINEELELVDEQLMEVVWGSELEAGIFSQDGVIDCRWPIGALQDRGGNLSGLVIVFEEAVVEHHLEEIASL